MVLFGYGDYDWGCSNVPSLAACNLFYKQILNTQPANSWPDLLGTSTGVGVRPTCAIPRVGTQDGAVGNVALIVVAGLSAIIAFMLAFTAGKRQAAVGRAEFRALFALYGLCCIFQLLDVGSFLTQGTTALTWLTGIHTGLVVGLFWTLAWVGFLSLQLIEDGQLSSIIPFFLGLVILVVGPTYIALDLAFNVTGYFRSGNPAQLHSAWLFSLTVVWPLAAATFYYIVNVGVVCFMLRERKPIVPFTLAALAFALAQGARFALSHRICSGTNAKIDGSFVGVILETITAILIYLSWKTITEDAWEDASYAYNAGDYDPGYASPTGYPQ